MNIRTESASPTFEPAVVEPPSRLKRKLGELRRRIKRIDLRAQLVAHPFAAVGIGLAAGAALGIARPKPPPGRVSSAIVAALGAIAYRVVREAAVRQIGVMAKEYIARTREERDERPIAEAY